MNSSWCHSGSQMPSLLSSHWWMRYYDHVYVNLALVFFYDNLINSHDKDNHRDHLLQVFEILRRNHLWVNRKKCCFESWNIEYLRHIIFAQGVATDPKKISDMVDWPTPKDLKALQGFLGLTRYYRPFVKGYNSIAWPLTQ